jgi:acyl dehydratase
MKLDPDLVGKTLAGAARDVSWRQTTNYAAAVGDANPRYLDDTRRGGIVAQPLFAAAVTWPVLSQFNLQLNGAIPPQVLPTVVHGSEHLQFHRLIQPGDQLRVGGDVAAVFPGRSGTRLVLRMTVTDAANMPVFTEYACAICRGVGCDGPGAGQDDLPEVPRFDEPESPIWTVDLDVPVQMPFLYDGCSDISFPIHTSVRFARAAGFPNIILQGTATLAMAARELINREGDGDPGRLKEIACRFTGVVLPGNPIRMQLLRKDRSTKRGAQLAFRVLDTTGNPVLRFGYARME